MKEEVNSANPIYSASEAESLTKSEQQEDWRRLEDKKKADLVLEHMENSKSLLEIGCGWGQILSQLVGKIPTLAGVDESPDRIDQLRKSRLDVKVYRNRASDLEIKDGSFDLVLTSHMLHEVKLFGGKGKYEQTLKEIKRVLKTGGRYFIIDHLDPGEGSAIIKLNSEKLNLLKEFRSKFKWRKVEIEENGQGVTLSKRDCQDFVTKIWAMATSIEDLEMRETHTFFNFEGLLEDMKNAGLKFKEWITFEPIVEKLDYYSIELVKGSSWDRKFMLILQKES